MPTASPQRNRRSAPLPGPRRLPPLLRRTWFALNQSFRARIAHVDLTPSQFTILRWLVELQPQALTQRQLSELMTSDANTMTALLRGMERAGDITRVVNTADRRAQLVRPTPQGLKKFHQAEKIANDLQDQVLQALPAERVAKFLSDLELISSACLSSLQETDDK